MGPNPLGTRPNARETNSENARIWVAHAAACIMGAHGCSRLAHSANVGNRGHVPWARNKFVVLARLHRT